MLGGVISRGKLACRHQGLKQDCQLDCHGRLLRARDHQVPRSNPRETFAVQPRHAWVVRRELVGVVLPFGDSPLLLGLIALPLLNMGLRTETQTCYTSQGTQKSITMLRPTHGRRRESRREEHAELSSR